MKTTILFLRHEEHGCDGAIKQELPLAARERARARGRTLKKLVPKIDAAYSSPQPRAYDTVVQTLIGHGVLMPIRTDDRMGDVAMAGIDPEPIKAAAKNLGVEVEELCMTPEKVSPEFVQIMLDRACEGANALREIASRHSGQTIIVGSHGGSRMEASILGLKYQLVASLAESFGELGQPKQMTERGQIVRLVIDADNGKLIEEEYLEP